METSENTATPSPAPANGAARRRSGRERRAPEKFQPEVTSAPKRKRAEDDEDDENQDPDGEDAAPADEDEDMSDDDDDSAEDSPDEEEQRAARRQQKSKKKGASQASRAKKPAAKKPKINGAAHPAATASSISVGLPSRPKAKKTARVVTGDRRDGDGVYGECRRV